MPNLFSTKIVQWVVMALALCLLIAHTMKWSAIEVDGTTLALLGLITIIPLIEYIRKIRLGDFEAEIQPREVAEVQEKASIEFPPESPSTKVSSFEEELLTLVRNDPQLGLAKVRIEIERVLRSIYDQSVSNSKPRASIHQMLPAIQRNVPLPKELAETVIKVVGLANRAVHGEFIRPEDAEAVAEVGARLVVELQQFHVSRILEPVETTKISEEERDKWADAYYRVTTVIPLVEEPRLNVRILSQQGLDEFLDGYEEYAEFLVGIERVPSDMR